MDEVKNPVPTGVHAGDQVRPSHRTLRWNAGHQVLVRSQLRELGKVRHLARLHETIQQLRVHAVDAENDEFLLPMPFTVGPLAGIEQQDPGTQEQRARDPDSFLQMHPSFNVPGPVADGFQIARLGPAENNRTPEGYLAIKVDKDSGLAREIVSSLQGGG